MAYGFTKINRPYQKEKWLKKIPITKIMIAKQTGFRECRHTG